MTKKIIAFIFLFLVLSLQPVLARDPYPNKPRLNYLWMTRAIGSNPQTLLNPNGTRSDMISWSCNLDWREQSEFVHYLTDPAVETQEDAQRECSTWRNPSGLAFTIVKPPFIKNNKQTPDCVGKVYNSKCYDSPFGSDFLGSSNNPPGFIWATPIVYGANQGRPSFCGPNHDQLCGPDCVYTPYGPKETFVRLTMKDSNNQTEECVAPPYSTSGAWWNWLVGEIDKIKSSSPSNVIHVGVSLGIDREGRPLKSDTPWRADFDIQKQFESQYVPAVIKEIQTRYPGAVIKTHTDTGLVDMVLDAGIDFHRESLNADGVHNYLYKGQGAWGWWQGFANYFWVTNSQGLQTWPPMYQTALAGMSMHTDHLTGLILNQLYQDGKPDFLRFLNEYMGKNINNTPGVWTHLRETKWKKEDQIEFSGKYGDYDFYSYRAEDLENNKTVPVNMSELPEGTRDQIYSFDRYLNTRFGLFVGRKNALNNKYMSFDIDDGYKYVGKTGVSFDIRIVYLDTGTDSFKFEYKNSSNEWKEKVITKTNTNLWQETKFTLTDAFFNNNASEGSNKDLYPTDFRLETFGSTIHLIEVRGNGNVLAVTKPKAQVSCDIVDNEGDNPRDGMLTVGLNRNILIKGTLNDNSGKPLPNERIMFAYNTEWNLTKTSKTNASGVAFSPLTTANRSDSSGFLGSVGGRDDKESIYSIQVYYPGSDKYQPSRNDCYLHLTSNSGKTDPKNTRIKITGIDMSTLNTTGKPKISYEVYNTAGTKIFQETTSVGRAQGFEKDDPNTQTINIKYFPTGYYWASTNVTLNGKPAVPVIPLQLAKNINYVSAPNTSIPQNCTASQKKQGYFNRFNFTSGSKIYLKCSQPTIW